MECSGSTAHGPLNLARTEASSAEAASSKYFSRVSNATVEIMNDDGSTITLPSSSITTYKNKGHYPVAGQHYKLIASAPGFKTVETEMTMPNVVPIIDVKWDSTKIPQTPPNVFIQFNIPFTMTFQDPPNQKNYYEVNLNVYGESFRYDPVTGEKITQNFITSHAVWIRDPAIAEEDEFVPLWSDASFDGKLYEANLDATFTRQPNQTVHRVELRLFNVSEEYYKYFETLRVARNVEGDPFAQPVQVYTNINDGLGVFAGRSAYLIVYKRKY